MLRPGVQLVWFEARRLALNPLLWAAVAYSMVRLYADRTPVTLPSWGGVTDDAVNASGLVAVGMFTAAVFPAVRTARYDTANATPVGLRVRVTALLVATALVGTVALVPHYALLLNPEEPVRIAGRMSAAALVVPVVLAMAGGATGVAAGVWLRSRLPALVVVVATCLYQIAMGDWLTLGRYSLLGMHRLQGLPNSVLQPAGWYGPDLQDIAPLHLGYAVFLLATALLAASLRHQSGRARRAVVAGLAAVCLTVTVAGYWVQSGYSDTSDEPLVAVEDLPWGGPVPDLACRDRGGLSYCSYVSYQQWTPYWERAVAPVVRAVPERARDDLPTIMQPAYARAVGQETGEESLRNGVAIPATPWTVGGDLQRIDLAGQAALSAVGAPGNFAYTCSLVGQARFPLYVWLTMYGHDDITDITLPSLEDPRSLRLRDLAAVVAMLDTDDQRIIRGLDEHWEEVTDPGADTRDLVRTLGVRVTDEHRERARDVYEEHLGVFADDFADFGLVEDLGDDSSRPGGEVTEAQEVEVPEPVVPGCR